MVRGKVSLIGFMGAGKSTVASLLAAALDFDCCEVDTAILLLANDTRGLSCATVADIIDSHGDTVFRDLEEQVARDLRSRRNLVVSTGGGVVGRPSNMQYLKESDGLVVFLNTRFQTVVTRLQNDSNRPFFRDRTSAQRLYDERLPLYEQWSDLTVETDLLPPEAVRDLILKGLS